MLILVVLITASGRLFQILGPIDQKEDSCTLLVLDTAV